MAVRTTIVRDSDFEMLAENVKPDAKNRVSLRKIKISEGVTYRIYRNRIGQIVLDPQVSIPASEAWLFEDKKALADVARGFGDEDQGRVKIVDPKTL